MINFFLAFWIAIGAVHLGLPLGYFAVMRRAGAKRDYALHPSLVLEPTVSVIVPTYNEATVIESKLADIAKSSYPSSKLQLIVVDSGSLDNTAEAANRFFRQNHLDGMVIEEEKRSGKSGALNLGLKRATGELVCISDAECRWDKNALTNAVKYFADPKIGSVSGVHFVPSSATTMTGNVEGSYRSVYRMLRIAESKLGSTPVGEGEIQLFRRKDMKEFDPNVGGDDTCGALCMVERGFRAISAEDVVFFDPAPPAWRARFRQKIRRGQHVLQAFLKHKKLLWHRETFSRATFPMEFFIYAINPLLFPVFLVLTGFGIVTVPIVAYLAIASVVLAALIPSLRNTLTTYLSNNITMLGAIFHEARGNKQLVWTKIEENRPSTTLAEQSVIAQ